MEEEEDEELGSLMNIISRLEEEYLDLEEKTDKLGAFMDTERFDNLHPTQKNLLTVQHDIMITYCNCLFLRLADLKD